MRIPTCNVRHDRRAFALGFGNLQQQPVNLQANRVLLINVGCAELVQLAHLRVHLHLLDIMLATT
jgi:hypothetical protein